MRTQTEIEMEKFKRREIIRELIKVGIETFGAFVIIGIVAVMMLIIGG